MGAGKRLDTLRLRGWHLGHFHGGDLLRGGVFVLVVSWILVSAASILFRRAVVRPIVPWRFRERVMLGLAALGVACMLYGRLVEPRWVEVTRTRIVSARLPAGHRNLRIVQLSDLHSDPRPLLEGRLPGIVAALHPDAILFTGDAANSREGVAVFRQCLSELAAIAPTFAVKGNWDVLHFADLDRFGGTGATELDGTGAALDVEGTTLRFVGAAAFHAEGLDAALATLPADGACIAMYHYPYPQLVAPANAARLDLLCAGHVHGGQVALPLFGAIVTESDLGKRYERGLYREGAFPMYVHRGIGMEGGPLPRVRFCSRPEVALIELAPAEARTGDP